MTFRNNSARIRFSSLCALTLGAMMCGAFAAATPTEQMAIVQHGAGGPDVLKYEKIPVLEPAQGQVLIKVIAAAVNPFDWKVRLGMGLGPPAGARTPNSSSTALPAAPPGAVIRPPGGSSDGTLVPGGDVAGTIDKVGPGVADLKVGDAVFALVGSVPQGLNGGYSQYVIAPVGGVARKPQGLTYVEAAGLGRVGETAARVLWQTKVDKGQRTLVTGAAGGVGSSVVQMAKALGATTIGVASGRHNDYLKSIGLNEFIDYTQGDWSAKAKNIDVAIDTVGGETASMAFKAVKRGGMFVTVVGAPDITPEKCAAAGVTCIGVDAPRGNQEQTVKQVAKLASEGKYVLKIDKTYPLAEAAKAQEDNRAGHTQGKIILIVDESRANKK